MNAVVMGATTVISSWVVDFISKIDYTIHKIGYIRAATELQRLGYYKEASRCRELINEFKKVKES